MNRRPPVSKCTEKNPTDLLDYFLNTSFDVVKAVHDKLPLIEEVAADIEKLEFILDNLEELKVLMELAVQLATDEGASLIGATGGKTVQEVLNELTDGKVDKIEGKGLSANDLTDLLLEKLESIEAGAQVNVPTNLGLSQQSGSSINITSSTGDDVLLEGATLIQAGLMTSTDKAKVDGIEDGAQVNVATNLGIENKTGSSLDISSSTGSSVTLAEATIAEAGLLSSQDKLKLAEIEPNAQVNVATNLAVGNRTPASLEVTSSTGSSVVLPSATTTQAGLLASSEKNKLAAVQDGATANSTDAELRDRATHTGESPIASVTGLVGALDEKVDKVPGLVLSQNSYTNDEKTKLAGLESPLFLGVYSSLMELEAAHPTSTRPGEYAFVPGDTSYFMFVFEPDMGRWTVLEGANAELTPAQLKTLYESNADTNAFTDALKTKLDAIQQGATANATNAQLRDRTTHTGVQPISTITGLETALANRQPLNTNLTNLAAVPFPTNPDELFALDPSGEWRSIGANGFLFLSTERTKLATIQDGAQVNHAEGTTAEAESGGTALRSWSSLRMMQASAAWWGNSNPAAKLNGIETGAQKNPDQVTQAEAEAGTGTTIRSWPVVRVWQATQAWYNNNLKATIDGLGTAARANLTTHSLDTTTGRVLKTGDGGFMGNVPTNLNYNIDDRTLRGKRYAATNTTTGTFPPGVLYGLVETFGVFGDAVVQEFWSLEGATGTYPKFYRQTFGDLAWGPWVALPMPGNPLQGQAYVECLTPSIGGQATDVLILTKIPYVDTYMPSIVIEGAMNGYTNPFRIDLSWHFYQGQFYLPQAMITKALGEANWPKIRLSGINGFVAIRLDFEGQVSIPRLAVRAIRTGGGYGGPVSMYQNWDFRVSNGTVANEALVPSVTTMRLEDIKRADNGIGSYVQYPDGTMESHQVVALDCTADVMKQGYFDMPGVFSPAYNPNITVSLGGPSETWHFECKQLATALQSNSNFLLSLKCSVTQRYAVNVHIKGRWK